MANDEDGKFRLRPRKPVARGERRFFDVGSRAIGFDRKNDSGEIVRRLEDWQRAGDERLWKIIISPECGDRADLVDA
jgi:hypothetical protein